MTSFSLFWGLLKEPHYINLFELIDFPVSVAAINIINALAQV